MMSGKGQTGADAQSWLKTPDQENAFWPLHFECELMVGTDPRERHLGQRRMERPHRRPNTWPHQPAEGRRPKRHSPTEGRPHTATYRRLRPPFSDARGQIVTAGKRTLGWYVLGKAQTLVTLRWLLIRPDLVSDRLTRITE